MVCIKHLTEFLLIQYNLQLMIIATKIRQNKKMNWLIFKIHTLMYRYPLINHCWKKNQWKTLNNFKSTRITTTHKTKLNLKHLISCLLNICHVASINSYLLIQFVFKSNSAQYIIAQNDACKWKWCCLYSQQVNENAILYTEKKYYRLFFFGW